MSANRTLLAIACSALVTSFSYLAVAQSGTPRDFKSSVLTQQKMVQADSSVRMNRLIVKFRSDVDDKAQGMSAMSAPERIQALNARTKPNGAVDGGVSLRYLKSVSTHTHVAKTSRAMDHTELSALAQSIAQDPRVEYAEVDERVYPHFVPNDTLYVAQQGYLKSPVIVTGGANLPNAWGRTAGGAPVSGAGVTVAVLDTGYRPHADLAANVVGGYDFVSADGFNDFFTANDGDGRDNNALDPGDWNTKAAECDVEDSSWHGTHAAGIIGAVGNNNAG
ncbi:MAG TPA: S8 family serine peptidase, partial [Rhodoferax sp.]|nr:S8 family serine peptidase [Rhodoferax sp.]